MLKVNGLCKAFGNLIVIDNVSLNIKKGERRVILGGNGAGKTTFFNLLAGELTPDSGEILLENCPIESFSVERRARLGLTRSYQKNNLFDNLSIKENLSLACASTLGISYSLTKKPNNNSELLEQIYIVAEQVGLTDSLETIVKHASYGNRRQLEVALALALKPRILLMDEPTSGVGPNMINSFNELLHSLPKDLTIVIVEHDVDLVFSIADIVTVLNYGKVVFEGTPNETRTSPLVNEIYLGKKDFDA